jgi:hypothetical protein
MIPLALFAGLATDTSPDLSFAFAGQGASDLAAFGAGPAVASISFLRTGLLDGSGNISYPTGAWIVPADATIGDDYEIEFSLVLGDTPTGTLDTWLALTSTRTITLSASSGEKASTIRVRIRQASDSEIVATGNMTLSAANIT